MYGHTTVEQALEELPVEMWFHPGVCGVWSVKQIIAHLASYEHLLVDVVNSLTERTPTLTLQRYLSSPSFNDDEVSKRSGLSAEQTWEEYTRTHVHALELITQVPPERQHQVGLMPWYGEQYDFEDFLAYAFYGHKREHAAQINAYKDYLGGRGPGLVTMKNS